ncbi:hypothetical protein SUGI_0757450 [Cryptomeria japonica]|nr:hypothetical protein SUGI_0757450 [Cryptomeria japonica]
MMTWRPARRWVRNSPPTPLLWEFSLYYEEIRLENLRNYILSTAQEEEWGNISMVFNLILNLPHMWCQRSKAPIVEFLTLARGMPKAYMTWAFAGMASEWRDYFWCGLPLGDNNHFNRYTASYLFDPC